MLVDFIFRTFLHCTSHFPERGHKDIGNACFGCLSYCLRTCSNQKATPHLSQSHPHFQGNSCGRPRRLYQIAFRVHILGCHLRSGMRTADIPAWRVYLYLDLVFRAAIHLYVPLLFELYAVLRTSRECHGKRGDRGRRHIMRCISRTNAEARDPGLPCKNGGKNPRMDWHQRLCPFRTYNKGVIGLTLYQSHIPVRIHQDNICNVFPRLDYRTSHRICQTTAHSISQTDGCRYFWKIRLYFSKPLYTPVQEKCRVYSCQMEKERNRIARPVANEGNSLCNKKSLNDNSKIS